MMKGVDYPQLYLGGDIVDLPPSWKEHNISFGLSAHMFEGTCQASKWRDKLQVNFVGKQTAYV